MFNEMCLFTLQQWSHIVAFDTSINVKQKQKKQRHGELGFQQMFALLRQS